MAPFEVRNLCFLCVCVCVSVIFFFSYRNIRAENAGKLPRLMEGRERAGRNTRGANSSGSSPRQVTKPTGCNTKGVLGPGQVEGALLQGIALEQHCFSECGESVPFCTWLVVLSGLSQHFGSFLSSLLL